MGAGLLDDERHGSVDKHTRVANCILAALPIALGLGCLLLIVCSFFYELAPPEFWMKVPGVEGLDRSTNAVTAPTFNIILRVNYKRHASHHGPLCGKGGSVVVAYAGVPLARGDLPEFCVPAGVVGSVPVVATREGLGLPDELYERMDGQLQRDERVPLAVHVRIDKLTGSRGFPCAALVHGNTTRATTRAIYLPSSVGALYFEKHYRYDWRRPTNVRLGHPMEQQQLTEIKHKSRSMNHKASDSPVGQE